MEIDKEWVKIPGCPCIGCIGYNPLPKEIPVKIDNIPLMFRVFLYIEYNSLTVLIQSKNTIKEHLDKIVHVGTNVYISKEHRIEERIRSGIALLLIHELDEGLEICGKILRYPHGIDSGIADKMAMEAQNPSVNNQYMWP